MMNKRYEIWAAWGPWEETAQACAARLARMLTAFASVHPALARWNKKANSRAAANKPFCAMPLRIEELTKIFEKGRSRKDVPRVAWPELGFSVSAWNGLDDDHSAAFSLHPGNYSDTTPFPNHVSVDLPTPAVDNDEWRSAGLLKRVLLAVVAAWAPDWAVIDRWGQNQRWSSPAGGLPSPWAGWMTYLSAPLACKVSPPSGSNHVQMPGGGLLMLATGEPFDYDNPAHLEALDMVQAALKPIQC